MGSPCRDSPFRAHPEVFVRSPTPMLWHPPPCSRVNTPLPTSYYLATHLATLWHHLHHPRLKRPYSSPLLPHHTVSSTNKYQGYLPTLPYLQRIGTGRRADRIDCALILALALNRA